MNTDTMYRVYLDAQKACGLQVGDYVKITRKAASRESGWYAMWTPPMDKCVGVTGRILEIFDSGVRVFFSADDCWNFPYFVLEKTGKPAHFFKPFDKVLVRNNPDGLWLPALFGFVNEGGEFTTTNGSWINCIPFEGNEHLLGINEPSDV